MSRSAVVLFLFWTLAALAVRPPEPGCGTVSELDPSPAARYLRLLTRIVETRQAFSAEALEALAAEAHPANPLARGEKLAKEAETLAFGKAFDQILAEGELDWDHVRKGIRELGSQMRGQETRQKEARETTSHIFLPVVTNREVVPQELHHLTISHEAEMRTGSDGDPYVLYYAFDNVHLEQGKYVTNLMTHETHRVTEGNVPSSLFTFHGRVMAVSFQYDLNRPLNGRIEIVDAKDGRKLHSFQLKEFPLFETRRHLNVELKALPFETADGHLALFVSWGDAPNLKAGIVEPGARRSRAVELPEGNFEFHVSQDGKEVLAAGVEKQKSGPRLVFKGLLSGKMYADGPSSREDLRLVDFQGSWIHESPSKSPSLLIMPDARKLELHNGGSGTPRTFSLAEDASGPPKIVKNARGEATILVPHAQAISVINLETGAHDLRPLPVPYYETPQFVTVRDGRTLALYEQLHQLYAYDLDSGTSQHFDLKKLGVKRLLRVESLPDGRVVGIFLRPGQGSHDLLTEVQLYGPRPAGKQ